mgnify:CR=1 FL=1
MTEPAAKVEIRRGLKDVYFDRSKVCFIDGRRCTERVLLADLVNADSRVHVLQALSGG